MKSVKKELCVLPPPCCQLFLILVFGLKNYVPCGESIKTHVTYDDDKNYTCIDFVCNFDYL